MKTTYSVAYVMRHKNNCEYAPNIPHGIQDAIAAAWWAGESHARAQERTMNRAAKDNLPQSRYHRLVAKVADLFNSHSAEGLQDESAEISGWQHDFTE